MSTRKITIRADKPATHIDFAELLEFRWVFWMLILRDIKLRYKQTVLGVAWVVLQPLMTATLFATIFGKMIKLPSDGLPYMLFAFCGLVPWLFFSQSMQRASNCLVNDERLITKVYFPRIYIPLAATFGVIIDFTISMGIAFLMMFLYGVPLSINVLFLPVVSMVLFLFCSGINLLFSGWNVSYRDFKHIVPFLIQLWMYASPLVYSGNLIPERYRLIYSLNPMAGIIDTFRWCLFGLGPFPLYAFTVSLICSLVFFVGGAYLFKRMERNFSDVI